MRRFAIKGLLFATGFLGPVVSMGEGVTSHGIYPMRNDPRLIRLRCFLERHGSPYPTLAEDFLLAADTHGLDWRLLPSIALVESGLGRVCMRNNIFGWDSGKHRFPSVRTSIYVVAGHLKNAPFYRGRSLEQVLLTYNGGGHYPGVVKRVMVQLGPRDLPPASAAD